MARARPLDVIGWRELLTLPDLCPTPMKVKIDTGARTSALHAFALQVIDRDGIPTATFEIHPRQRSKADAIRVEVPIHEMRDVRSSNGHVERRPVIRTRAMIGEIEWPIDITLTSRDQMGFRMLLGRAALRRRFLVNPGRSHVQSLRPGAVAKPAKKTATKKTTTKKTTATKKRAATKPSATKPSATKPAATKNGPTT